MMKVAIIGGGIMASYLGEACHRLGYEGHVFSLIDGKVDERKIDFFHEVNIFDKEKIVEICKKNQIAGVVATTELTVSVAAYVADKLGLLGNPVEVANALTDKYRNRECIKGLTNLHSPLYVKTDKEEDILSAGIPYPIILKPVDLGGKRGVFVASDESSLRLAFNYAMDSYGNRNNKLIIAEQFLAGGIECSVESLSFRGQHTVLQITRKDSSGPPHCVELGHHQPAMLDKDMWDKVVSAVDSGLTAIGLTNGPCHTEIKIINNEIYLIEFNARPGGDHIWWPMIELSTGFDVMAAIIQAAVGRLEPIDVTKFKRRFSGLYYVVEQTKALKPIFDKCQDEPWCWEKNFVTDEMIELEHNDMEHTNYMIYSSDEGDPVENLLKNS